jgi:alkylation response protein AidB-like acyl-CoA dehydrogenase
VQDYLFLLNDVFHIERYADVPGYADLSPDIVEATLTEAARLCRRRVSRRSTASATARAATRHEDGSVHHAARLQGGLRAVPRRRLDGLRIRRSTAARTCRGPGRRADRIHGGGEHFARDVRRPDPGRDRGAAAPWQRRAQKRVYLPKMVASEWTGTMNLTEAHAGTDLGLLRTRASRRDDGSFAITGTKIFISAGEHDLAENIIHLVLARIEGAPSGVHGISLFVVPKFIPAADGSVGPRNAVSCGSIEHKMGIHGNSTCVMNFDGATGWLVGEENRGLNALFTMMNEARLGTGTHGIAIGEAAYQNAAAYAHERLQGRALTGKKSADKPADPIVAHPDVRRMLLTIRATTEAARALASGPASRATWRKAPPIPRCARRRRATWRCSPPSSRRSARTGARQRGAGPAGLRRPRLHRRAWHGAVRARRARQPDLRGRQRHPGDGPRRAQARDERRQAHEGVHRGGRGLAGAPCRPAALAAHAKAIGPRSPI